MENTVKYAIIGGTGIENLSGLEPAKTIETPFGNAIVNLFTSPNGVRIAFLSRHGAAHDVPPHKVNYRANIYALHLLGVRYILTSNAVGSCHRDYRPGTVCIITDFLDFTKQREHTFFNGDTGVVHTAVEDIYCPNLNRLLSERIQKRNIPCSGDAVYVCTEGPRFETAAEIRMYNLMGAHVVGMTSVPEAPLARELNICYASVGAISNFGTGMQGNLNSQEINDTMKVLKPAITELMIDLFETEALDQAQCQCAKKFK